MQRAIDDLIDSISIIKGNLSHIEKTGKINGTLRAEIKRIMLEYKNQLSERTNTQETPNKHETEQLNILGVSSSLSAKADLINALTNTMVSNKKELGEYYGIRDNALNKLTKVISSITPRITVVAV